MEDRIIYILTRTSNRPNLFKICSDSIKKQTYKNIRHIVSVDNVNDLKYVSEVKPYKTVFIDREKIIKNDSSVNPNTGKYSPHNLYFNEMHKFIIEDDAWVMYLDDDDVLKHEYVIENIVNEIDDTNELYYWRMKQPNGNIIPIKEKKFDRPEIGNIGSCCFLIKKKLIGNVEWDGWK